MIIQNIKNVSDRVRRSLEFMEFVTILISIGSFKYTPTHLPCI